jgi:CHAT domain-containing protein
LEFAERAAEIARQVGLRELLWQSRTTAGRAYRSLNKPTQARQALEEALTTIESLRTQVAGGEQEQQSFFEDKVSPYHALVELLVAQNQTSEALVYAERAKARVLLDVLHSGRVNITKALTANEQERERNLNNQLVSLNTQIYREKLRPQSDQARLTGLNAQLQKAQLEYEAFQTNLYAAHPELKVQRGEAQALTLDQVSALLPDAKSALLEFVVAEDKTYLFVLTKNEAGIQGPADLKAYTLEIKRKDLADRAAAFRQQLAQRDLVFQESARALYDLLLKPARAQLQGKTALVIVPDSALWELPFQALQPAPTRYLVEDHAIAYAPSLTVLREMVKARGRRHGSTAVTSTLLAFGNPALGKRTVERVKLVLMDERLDPLPEAEKQVKIIGRLYGPAQSKVYIGAEAREERAKAEAGSYRILHLATHGVLNDASPMYSHVLLAQIEEQGKEDGLLEAWELMKLNLNADLVVLSACETARGRVGAGEGMIGLTWALFVAGVPTTVVSQWKVRSDSTAELMVEFHRQLKTRFAKPNARISIAEALRGAALKLMGNRKYRHPFHWAGFVAVGDGY